MKQIAIIIFILSILTAAHAQKGSGIELGFGVDAAVPVGNDLKPYTTAGFGGDATLGYNFDGKYALLIRGGYLTFLTKQEYRDHNVKSIGDGFIKVVGRYTFSRRFYVEPQLGLTQFTSSSGGPYKINSSGLTYAAAAGVFLDPFNAFDLSLRYEGTACKKGINYVGLRLAYSLKPGTFF